MINRMKKNNGFTLIELLVTISIIAVLTSLLTVNFIGARERGRDGQRKSSLFQIQSALELYRADNSNYPTTMPACGACLSSDGDCSGGSTIYMQKIPCDPSSSDSSYTYTSSDGISYSLVACLENEADSEKDEVTDGSCTDTTGTSYTITNP